MFGNVTIERVGFSFKLWELFKEPEASIIILAGKLRVTLWRPDNLKYRGTD